VPFIQFIKEHEVELIKEKVKQEMQDYFTKPDKNAGKLRREVTKV
jgi:hypothetical protein